VALWDLGAWKIDRPAIMGILNVTPDSFSDGGKGLDPATAITTGLNLIGSGAAVLDIGGESTRPGAEPVSLEEELRRVLPVIEGLSRQVTAPISIDTTKAEVARRALAAGAVAVNDVSGASLDENMLSVVAEASAGLVLMHMHGLPPTMQDRPVYSDVVAEVLDFLAQAVERARKAGISRASIAIDPGIGFGKTMEHNLTLLHALPRLQSLGCAVLIGTSRKRFLGLLTGREVGDRQAASIASALAALAAGADIVRVHDVAATADAIKVWGAQRGWELS
jgi:dihydropteroate synthase